MPPSPIFWGRPFIGSSFLEKIWPSWNGAWYPATRLTGGEERIVATIFIVGAEICFSPYTKKE